MSTKRTKPARREAPVKRQASPAMAPADLRKIRNLLGLTQQLFGERLGVAMLTVQRWEAGAVPISKSRALAIRVVAADVATALSTGGKR